MKQFNLSGVSKGTVVRAIMMIVVLVNYVLTATGHAPINVDENVIGGVVVIVITVLTFVQSYWKNNSWTKAAQEADKHYEKLKGEK